VSLGCLRPVVRLGQKPERRVLVRARGTWRWRGFALRSALMTPLRLAVAAGLVGFAACNQPDAVSTGFTTPGVTTRPDGTSGGDSTSTSGGASSSSTSAGSTGSGAAEGSSGTSTTEATFPDMGSMPDFGGSPMGCKGKIDLLFVISRAGNMGPAQAKLVAAAPDFIATIQAQFDDFDLHIMVVDSEEGWWVEDCEFKTCPDSCDIDPNYPCGYQPTACDTTLGAGTIFNAGPNAADEPCELGEHRYITKDTPNIDSAFKCIARVGTWGNNEMGDALLGAVSPTFNAPGGCNAGFVRDDALLVLTMIGPEDEFGPGGSKAAKWQEWREAVVEAKHGDLNAIVALGIVSGDWCMPDLDPKYRLCNLIPSFPHSVLEHLTLDNFGGAFDKAAALALEACSLFVPG